MFNIFKVPVSEMQNSVKVAIGAGYRHIDGAWAYQNEEALGEALLEQYKEGKTKREDIFITSKVSPKIN